MKKCLSHIFTIYLFVIACLPCTDIHASEVLINPAIEIISANNHTDCPHETAGDNCSPFCICSCCGSTVTIPFYTPIALKTATIVAVKQMYYPLTTISFQEVYSNVWRPPIV